MSADEADALKGTLRSMLIDELGNSAGTLAYHLLWECKPDMGGHFYLSERELEDATGLGRDARRTARRELERRGVARIDRRGPRGSYRYHLSLGQLATLLEGYAPKGSLNEGDDPF
jgi:hypothetical protein